MIMVSLTFIELCQKYMCNKNFEEFHWLKKCEATDIDPYTPPPPCYCRSSENSVGYFKRKVFWFEINWLYNLNDTNNISGFIWYFKYAISRKELAELQNDESVKTLFNIKGAMVWLCGETEIKCARNILLPFPPSYLATFSAINDLLQKS